MIGADIASELRALADDFEDANRGSFLWVSGELGLKDLVGRMERERLEVITPDDAS